MTIIQKLKKNKNVKWIAIAVLIVMLWASTGEKKEAVQQSFETCNQYNKFSWIELLENGWQWEDGTVHWWGASGDEIDLCEAVHCVVAEVLLREPNPEVCVPYALKGWAVTIKEGCKDGLCTTKISGDRWLCKECGPGEEPYVAPVCNKIETDIGDIIKDVFPNQSCKSRYYIVIIGGAFLATMFLLAVM